MENNRQFKKIPIVVEAIQWMQNFDEIKSFCPSVVDLGCDCNPDGPVSWPLIIPTTNGHVDVKLSDWIIKEPNGGYYVCKAAYFEKTYEPRMEYKEVKHKFIDWFFGQKPYWPTPDQCFDWFVNNFSTPSTIEQGQQGDGWISVEDELPKESGVYDVKRKYSKEWEMGGYFTGFKFTNYQGYPVTHWRKPQPPIK